MTRAYGVRNLGPCLGQEQKCVGFIQINVMPTPPPVMIGCYERFIRNKIYIESVK
jgi:hypothetical protein